MSRARSVGSWAASARDRLGRPAEVAEPLWSDPLRVAVVGCGKIAEMYIPLLRARPELDLVGAFDIDGARARLFREQFQLGDFPTIEALLASDAEVVVNLTPARDHADVSKRCIAAGKHVYSEKPLALTAVDCGELVSLATEAGVRLAVAPSTLLGPPQQLAWQAVRRGCCGRVRTVRADIDPGRVEAWHPDPRPFYQLGPLVDVGVYPLTFFTALFGPVRSVWGHTRILAPERTDVTGEVFSVEGHDWALGLAEFSDGVVGQINCAFYAGASTRCGIELYGDDGTLTLSDHQNFDADVKLALRGQKFRSLQPLRPNFKGVDWSAGLVELACAVRENRAHRADAAHAAHVHEALDAMVASARAGGSEVKVTSVFTPPAPMPWSL